MSATTWSWVVWGGWFALFLALEFSSIFGWTPWNSLSQTAWDLEAKSHWVSILLLAGLAVLLVHIIFGPKGPAG